jgi:hypothetical protein
MTDCKTICVRSTPQANSPSLELALEIAPPIHPGLKDITSEATPLLNYIDNLME